MRVAVVDHGMGNLRSVARALQVVGAEPVVTSSRDDAARCDALCVPGQGIFGRCMGSLTTTGFDELIVNWIGEGRPYLGICLGMQVLFDSSDEAPGAEPIRGLGIVHGRVVRLPAGVIVPHIGWNTIHARAGALLGDGDYFYFDHSYAAVASDAATVAAWCDHGLRFAAAVRVGSILAVQFHPEKSGRSGLRLLEEWCG